MQAMLKIDDELVREEVRRQTREALLEINELWFVSAATLRKKLDMGANSVEEILNDPRMKVIMIKRTGGKRWYPADEAKEIIHQIMNEW
ncbi:hypothetical protein SAMN04488100_10554 [Alkalibacterium putridalgicola]|uniref:Uncharacterized protein n=1 Tax=Alkalibacterium putridalgicola TaxID=426703 RepID=A0A1H7RN81_9LACT|nr:hypothetical protein [Alkalibacterium putridalgicola]GEK88913.1 hypothetical protein APU01nite_09520 [Alkalibacterium putridalgicola]SEL61653.1 hypothetical protein SAMN04488100_10554 [Alkalibacterium putridalgicola]